MLILNYLGQGADHISSGTYRGRRKPILCHYAKGISYLRHHYSQTMAAVIASQVLISGSFTIFSEAVNLGFWPRLRD